MRSAERVMLAPAFLLHQHPWRESSRILEVFSRDHGRVGLVARGIRRPGSPFRAVLAPFRPLLLSWNLRGELGTLTQVEVAGTGSPLSGDSLMGGFYLNELLLLLTARHDPQPELYDRYAATLLIIADSNSLESGLRLFELHLLQAIGYGLNLERDAASGEPIRADANYRFEPERGLVSVPGDAATGLVVHGTTVAAMLKGELNDPGSLREARKLMRAALDVQLGGRRLKTRDVLRELDRFRAPATRH
ncbi:MAG TPA: DNA repair protein RecO [Gammaproteobacteria bacterium]|nr:DNA repair protein RecO [Gammaproteobacteria bacterium]